MYERARINLVSEIAPALKVSTEAAEQYRRRPGQGRPAPAEGQPRGQEGRLSTPGEPP